MRPLVAIVRVTVQDAVRSRVAAALVLGLGAALLVLAVETTGDDTAVGRERAFMAAALDATWALLALAAVFLSTTSLARELEDGRAVPIGVTPVRPWAVLLGKCLGIGSVLGVVLALALSWTVGVVLFRSRSAAPADRARIEGELLVARAQLQAPSVDAESEAITARARVRLEAIAKEGLPHGMTEESALKRLRDDEVVHALSVGPGRVHDWTFEPLAVLPETLTVRFRYRVLGRDLEVGQGPRGLFTLDADGARIAEWPTTAMAGVPHELTVRLSFANTGGIGGADTAGAGAPRDVRLKLSYENLDKGLSVVFPPEGPSILVPDRALAANVAAAYGLLLGRLVFLTACGLALSTFLEGRVAALATFFVLAVAAAHGFLDDAVGPVLAAPDDNVFGLLDVPVKVLLRAVLWVLPDLGRHDAGESLALGRDVLGAGPSLLLLALVGGGGAIAIGSALLARRELA